MMRVTASKVGLFYACLWWATDGAEWSDSTVGGAAIGGAVHDICEARCAGRAYSIDAIARARGLDEKQRAVLGRLVEAIKRHKVPALAGAEVAFAYDPIADTGRELGRGLDRDYTSKTDAEIAGTADLVWMDGDAVVVADWKSGYFGALADHREQLEFLALAAARAYRATSARIVVLHVTEDGVEPDEAALEDYELDDARDRLRARIAELASESVEPTPGTHCSAMYCPAVASCPRAHAAVAELVPAAALVRAPAHKMIGPIASQEEARYRLEHLPLLKKAVALYEKQVKEYADANGIETDGGTWGPIAQTTSAIQPTAEAMDILERELGHDGQQAAISIDLSAASIKRAVKAKGIRPVGATVDRIVAAIKEAGAVRYGTKTVYDVRRAREDSAPIAGATPANDVRVAS